MNIKKYQGKTSEEATETAKRELGENVVVLATKTVRPKWYQFFKKPYVEVTVAKEEESVGTKAQSEIAEVIAKVDSIRQNVEREKESAKAIVTNEREQKDKDLNEKDLNEKLDHIQSLLQEKLKASNVSGDSKDVYGNRNAQYNYGNDKEVNGREATSIAQAGEGYEVLSNKDGAEKKGVAQNSTTRNNSYHESSEDNLSSKDNHKQLDNGLEDFLELLHETMLDNEVNREYADKMIAEVKENMRDGMEMEYILSQIYQKMILQFGKADCISPSKKKGPKLVYFIGPTGVGKTTTLAKVASQLCVLEGHKIALFTADTYRIAATDQLKTYANIMNVPFHIIYSVEEMQTQFDLYKDYEYILVDTAGHSHHNEEQRVEMNSFVHAFDDKAEKEVYLVLSATTKYRDLVSIAETYKEMTDYKLIFTKLDETSTYGNLLNLRIHTGANLSYVTCGQNVPDDIAKFDPQDTVKKLLSTEEE